MLVAIPNKIAKRMGDKKKKPKKANPWAILAMFNPKMYWDLMEKLQNKKRRRR